MAFIRVASQSKKQEIVSTCSNCVIPHFHVNTSYLPSSPPSLSRSASFSFSTSCPDNRTINQHCRALQIKPCFSGLPERTRLAFRVGCVFNCPGQSRLYSISGPHRWNASSILPCGHCNNKEHLTHIQTSLESGRTTPSREQLKTCKQLGDSELKTS